jgi:transcriptional regulator with XRE-family HTH domain
MTLGGLDPAPDPVRHELFTRVFGRALASMGWTAGNGAETEPVITPPLVHLHPSIEEQKSFKIAEIARLFGITIQGVHRWVRVGKLRVFRRASKGGRYMIPRAEVVRLLERVGREVPGLWTRPGTPGAGDITQPFGAILKHARLARGWTLEQGARRARSTKGYLSGLETGRVRPPSADLVLRLAKLYNLDRADLLLRSVIEKAPKAVQTELRRRVFGTTSGGRSRADQARVQGRNIRRTQEEVKRLRRLFGDVLGEIERMLLSRGGHP